MRNQIHQSKWHLKSWMTAALTASCLAISCSSGSGGGDGDGRIAHQDPTGFSLSHSAGWNVSFEKGAFIQVASPDAKSKAIVFPFLSPIAISAKDCLAKTATIFSDVMPSAKLIKSEQKKQNPDETVGRYQHSDGKGHAVALCSVDGVSGVLYLAVMPEDESSLNEISQIFRSLRFGEPKAASPAKDVPGLTMKDWVDPNERSFRIKVPESWSVEGGLYRYASVDTRMHLRLTSPEKDILVAIGDKDMPPLVTPMMGFPDGSTYNPSGTVTFYVKTFSSGGQFAAEYLTNAAEHVGCPGASASGEELQQMTASMQQQASQGATAGIRVIPTAGQAQMSCKTNAGADRVGYLFAITTLTTQNTDNSGTWLASVAGYASPKSREAEARHVAATAYRSFQYEQDWFQRQQGLTAATSQIVTKTSQEIADIFSSSYQARQTTMDRTFRQWSNATLGQTDVVDPTTGDAYKVASGRNYYWRKSGTNIVGGTDQHERPDIDFTPMVEF